MVPWSAANGMPINRDDARHLLRAYPRPAPTEIGPWIQTLDKLQ